MFRDAVTNCLLLVYGVLVGVGILANRLVKFLFSFTSLRVLSVLPTESVHAIRQMFSIFSKSFLHLHHLQTPFHCELSLLDICHFECKSNFDSMLQLILRVDERGPS